MGGKAFGFEAKRMSKTEYGFILMQNLRRINHIGRLDWGNAEGVISVKDKEDFGDIDILVKKQVFSFERFWEEYSSEYKDYKKNSDVVSLLDHQDRQIDLILTPIYLFDTHFDYLAYNDLGNFVGRLARAVGLKYGHDGLSLVVRDPNNSGSMIGTIKVYEDTGRVYNLLGLDSIEGSNGFNNMEEVYKFIMSSKYYHKDSFLLEKQSNKARVRDRKRKSYSGMLNYIKENDASNSERRKYSIFETLSMLPEGVRLKYIRMVTNNDQSNYKKTLFNGKVVMEVTGLKGKELGAFISYCKDKVDLSGNVNLQVKVLFNRYKDSV